MGRIVGAGELRDRHRAASRLDHTRPAPNFNAARVPASSPRQTGPVGVPRYEKKTRRRVISFTSMQGGLGECRLFPAIHRLLIQSPNEQFIAAHCKVSPSRIVADVPFV
jgi:hypothetical protein